MDPLLKSNEDSRLPSEHSALKSEECGRKSDDSRRMSEDSGQAKEIEPLLGGALPFPFRSLKKS